MRFSVSCLALLAGLAVATPVLAQTEVAEDEATEVVIVSSLTDKVLDRRDIERLQANDLGDLFRATPSVAVGGSLGIAQKIYVRGLEDSLLNVTVDGAPQRGTLFHHIGRVTIEPELLETVSLQAGAGEATSGFGAVGGAIRFRTRDADDLLEPGRNFGAILKTGWFSNAGQKHSVTGYARLFGDVGVVASYVTSDRDNFKDGDGQEQMGTAARQDLGFLKVGGDLGSGHRVSASYETRNEKGSFGQRPNWPVLQGDRLFPGEGQRDTVVFNHRYSGGAVSVETTLYTTKTEFTQDRYDRWGLYGADIETSGFDVRGRFSAGSHRLIAGIEHRSDQVVSQYLADSSVWADWAWDADVGRFQEKGTLNGLYVQDRWRVSPVLELSFGARYDQYDLKQTTYGGSTDSDGLSVNFGLNYNITPNLTFNAGYAEAFRGKEIGDAFTLEKRPGRISLAPGLQPETVDNMEIGLKWARDGFTASAVYYDMSIDNVILDQMGTGPAPQDATYYENVGTFTSRGIELKAGYRSGPFSIDGFYNSYDSELNGHAVEGYEEIALGNSMGDNWNLTAGYVVSDTLDLSASVTHVQDLNDIEVLFRNVELGWIDDTRFIDKPGYTVVDLFANWRPFSNPSIGVQAAIYNLFDEQYRAHASVGDYSAIPDYEIVQGIPEPGRNVRLTLSVRY